MVLKSSRYSSSPLFSLISKSNLSINSLSTRRNDPLDTYAKKRKQLFHCELILFSHIPVRIASCHRTLKEKKIEKKLFPLIVNIRHFYKALPVNVALRNAGSGTRVTSKNGATMDGMKFNL